MADSKIEWTDKTWNPVIGCSKVSEGCRHCYAMWMAYRCAACGIKSYKGLTKKTPSGIEWTNTVRCLPEKLEDLLHWKKPCRIFVNSMSDLFHPDVPDQFIIDVFLTMSKARQHTFQILTKRPERMLSFFQGCPASPPIFPLPNVWIGVSVENQIAAEKRIRLLLETPAEIRFLSVEPLFADVDISEAITPPLYLNKVDWVIAGCESGPGRRPAKIEWFRSLKDQCTSAGIPFFLKQMEVNGKIEKMPVLDGRVWNQYPGCLTGETKHA